MGAVGWFRDLVFDADDMHRLADFWCGVLGVEVAERYDDFLALASATRAVAISRSNRDESRPARLRTRASGPTSRWRISTSRTRRIEELGGRLVRVVHESEGDTHHVMADPEGNEFCIVKPPPFPLGSAPTT